MKVNRILITILLNLVYICTINAQQDSITKIAKQNFKTFTVTNQGFQGKGWEELLHNIKQTNDVLIGEDHFSNEIPYFVSQVEKEVKFDNFFCEIDPYSAKIIQEKKKSLSEEEFKNYRKNFGDLLSFYALDPEFRLIDQLLQSKTSIFGTDQILLVADGLLCHELQLKTKNSRAKLLYEKIEKQSRVYFSEFQKDQNKPLFMFTDEFNQIIKELMGMNLSKEEKQIVGDLQLTARIYKTQDHDLRIQLMKNNLMQQYANWEKKKNLFKYGAVHMPSGESLLEIYDLGNLVHNIADSNFKKSLHIMIVGKSGTKGTPFKGAPIQIIDDTDSTMKALKPFLDNVASDQWCSFDTKSIREAITKKKLIIDNMELLRIINGYNYVVIIPKVTPAQFPEFK